MYHGVVELQLPFSCWTIISRDAFVRQMAYLKSKYRVVSLSDVVQKKTGDTRCAVITFDDGLLNTYEQAWPVLRENGLTATLFVVPQLSEQGKLIWADQLFSRLTADPSKPVNLTATGFGEIPAGSIDDRVKRVDTILTAMKTMPHAQRESTFGAIVKATEQLQPRQNPFGLMTPEQIKELANSAEFTVCAHTNTHPILSTQSRDEQKKEIAGSIAALQQWNIPTAPLFAYPNGRKEDFNTETVTIVKEAGCKAAVSTIDGLYTPGDDVYQMKRVNIGGDVSDSEFRARCSGLYYFIIQLIGK